MLQEELGRAVQREGGWLRSCTRVSGRQQSSLQQAGWAHCVNGRSAFLTITRQWTVKIIVKLQFRVWKNDEASLFYAKSRQQLRQKCSSWKVNVSLYCALQRVSTCTACHWFKTKTSRCLCIIKRPPASSQRLCFVLLKLCLISVSVGR